MHEAWQASLTFAPLRLCWTVRTAGNSKPKTPNSKPPSDRPLLRQIFSEPFIFRVIVLLSAQALERRDDFFLADFERIGDHTRGLFEAHASVTVSAAHALQDVYILVVLCHTRFFACSQLTGSHEKSRSSASWSIRSPFPARRELSRLHEGAQKSAKLRRATGSEK